MPGTVLGTKESHEAYLSREDVNLAGMKLYSFHDKGREPIDEGTKTTGGAG